MDKDIYLWAVALILQWDRIIAHNHWSAVWMDVSICSILIWKWKFNSYVRLISYETYRRLHSGRIRWAYVKLAAKRAQTLGSFCWPSFVGPSSRCCCSLIGLTALDVALPETNLNNRNTNFIYLFDSASCLSIREIIACNARWFLLKFRIEIILKVWFTFSTSILHSSSCFHELPYLFDDFFLESLC